MKIWRPPINNFLLQGNKRALVFFAVTSCYGYTPIFLSVTLKIGEVIGSRKSDWNVRWTTVVCRW